MPCRSTGWARRVTDRVNGVTDRHPAGSVHDEPRGRAGEDGLQLVKGRALWSGSELRVEVKVGARDCNHPSLQPAGRALTKDAPMALRSVAAAWRHTEPVREHHVLLRCGVAGTRWKALSCASRGLTMHR